MKKLDPRRGGGSVSRGAPSTIRKQTGSSLSTSLSSSGLGGAGGIGGEVQAEYARIQVLVRVRPLHEIEVARRDKVVLQPDGEQKLEVWDPACFDSLSEEDIDAIDPACWSRDFAFDKCLWSLNEEDEGYASQDTVFEGED